MKNTEVTFLYRDASNYKEYITVVLKGEITKEQITSVMTSLVDDMYFIPEQIGLPIRRPMGTITIDDHCFCELYENDFSITDEDISTNVDYEELPENGITVEEFVKKFTDVGSTGCDSIRYAVGI